MQNRLGAQVRHILLHYRLFKNGGSVIDRILDKNFGDSLVSLNGNSPSSTLRNSDLLTFLREHSNVDAVSSHHLRPPHPESEEFVFFDIMFVRHPLDRICVMFEAYQKMNDSADSLRAAAARGDLRAFVEQLLSDCPHLVNNAQVNCLANGGRYFRPPQDSDLHKAVQVMEKAALPGVTSIFSLSLATAEYYLRPAFNTIDLSFVSSRPCFFNESWRARVAHLREVCGSTIYEQLLEMNRLDLQLCERTEKEVCRRFHLIPNHDQRLQNFVARCQEATQFFLEHDDIDA